MSDKENQRYVSTVTFYTYGYTPEEAFFAADTICSNLRTSHDNNAEVEKFHRQPFGTAISEEIDFKKLTIDVVSFF